jgi:hypothetical protein
LSELPHVHAPQHGIHTWRDFVVHIAVVTIGLLLAIGLQQMVEFVHHREQRAQLEEQMRETFVANSELIADDLKKLATLRTYVVDHRLAVDARLEGRSVPAPPAETDPRNFNYAPPPDLGAYDAAKANGTVALLSLDKIRLYDRVAVSNEMMQVDFRGFFTAMSALRKFRLRFEITPVPRYRFAHLDLTSSECDDKFRFADLLDDRPVPADILRSSGIVSSRALMTGRYAIALSQTVGCEAGPYGHRRTGGRRWMINDTPRRDTTRVP